MTEPVETSEEIAEAEPPARAGGGKHAAETPTRAIDEPNQDRECNEGNGPDIRRRQCQRRRRAGEDCDQDTPPSLSKYDRLGEAAQRHDRRADFDGAWDESFTDSSLGRGTGELGAPGGASGAPGVCRLISRFLPFCRSRLR